MVLEEFGDLIAAGGSGMVISSQSGYRMPALTAAQDALLATAPAYDLLDLDPAEVAALAAHIMGPEGGFITGSDFLIDGGATADFFYGPPARS